MSALVETLTSLTLFFVIFFLLEKLFTRHKQDTFRKEWFTDLLFFLGQYLVWITLSIFVLLWLREFFSTLPFTLAIAKSVQAQPYWIQVLEVIFLCDLSVYWAHRLAHRIDFLWRFHRVHHTTKKLDWIAAYREHPLDNVYTRVVENLPAFILGFPLETLAGFMVFRGLWSLYIHSNTDISIGYLKYLIGSPILHHWHHEVEMNSRCNFTNLSPLMDILFGTFYDPKDKKPKNYGIPEKISHNYFLLILSPFFPEKFIKKLTFKKEKSSKDYQKTPIL